MLPSMIHVAWRKRNKWAWLQLAHTVTITNWIRKVKRARMPWYLCICFISQKGDSAIFTAFWPLLLSLRGWLANAQFYSAKKSVPTVTPQLSPAPLMLGLPQLQAQQRRVSRYEKHDDGHSLEPHVGLGGKQQSIMVTLERTQLEKGDAAWM